MMITSSTSVNIWSYSNFLLIYTFFLAYMSSPCHIEVILAEKQKFVAKVPKDEAEKKKVSKKKLARQKEKLMHE